MARRAYERRASYVLYCDCGNTPDSLTPAPFSLTGTGSPAGKARALSGKTSTGISTHTPAGALAATKGLATTNSYTSFRAVRRSSGIAAALTSTGHGAFTLGTCSI